MLEPKYIKNFELFARFDHNGGCFVNLMEPWGVFGVLVNPVLIKVFAIGTSK